MNDPGTEIKDGCCSTFSRWGFYEPWLGMIAREDEARLLTLHFSASAPEPGIGDRLSMMESRFGLEYVLDHVKKFQESLENKIMSGNNH